jgi:hypothetical protein
MSLDKLKLLAGGAGRRGSLGRLSADGRFYEPTVRHAKGTTSNLAVTVGGLEQNADWSDNLIQVLKEEEERDVDR